MPAFYRATIRDFLEASDTELLGKLSISHANEGYESQRSDATVAWFADVKKLQGALQELVQIFSSVEAWSVLLEYEIPRRAKRIDVVILANDVIFVLETKTRRPLLEDYQQVEEYALLLHYFHARSSHVRVVPLVLSDHAIGKKNNRQCELAFVETAAYWISPVCEITWQNLPLLLADEARKDGTSPLIDSEQWDNGEYYPVPSIIDAASSLRAGLSIPEIAHSRAARHDVTKLTRRILDIAAEAQRDNKHVICFVTGVPGSGKTLVGLSLAFSSRGQGEALSFMSGNGPLVRVLQAIFKDYRQSVEKYPASEARIHARTLIEDVHLFAKTYTKTTPSAIPSNHVVIFDEAQRAWDYEQSRLKFGRETSEPTMFLQIMERHQDWALIVALVGGGQEINDGEAGLAEWGRALATTNRRWQILASPEVLRGGNSVAGATLMYDAAAKALLVTEEDDLHLQVSVRSLKAENYAQWVNHVISGDAEAAGRSGTGGFPVYLSRNLDDTRASLRNQVVGRSRIGLVGSSKASRLRAEGLEPNSDFHGNYDWDRWYLAPTTDVRASNQLEVFATEFEIQGLELDWIGLCWGGDLVWSAKERRWIPRKFINRNVSQWSFLRHTKRQEYRLNSYRVLLTRARQGLIIFVPRGDSADPTRVPNEFDDTATYLLECGVLPLGDMSIAAASDVEQLLL
jgi:hypothetical protein